MSSLSLRSTHLLSVRLSHLQSGRFRLSHLQFGRLSLSPPLIHKVRSTYLPSGRLSLCSVFTGMMRGSNLSSKSNRYSSSNKTSTTFDVDANKLPKEMGLSANPARSSWDDDNDNQPFDICLGEEFFEEPSSDCTNCGQEMRNIEENGQVLGDGLILLRNYLSLHEQVDIVTKCRNLGLGPGGFYNPTNRYGKKMRLYMMCLGLDWNPITQVYEKIRQHDGAVPPSIPFEFSLLVENAIRDSHTLIKSRSPTSNPEDVLPRMTPDVCLVNYYKTSGGLALHRHTDESVESLDRGLPIVTLSLGDSGEFVYGKKCDVNKAEKVVLKSGDVLIFGGESRKIYHGVSSIIPNTAPPLLVERAKLRPGRICLSFREY